MAKPGNKNNKARCERYKHENRRAINKEKKAKKHEKLIAKFKKRKKENKTYKYCAIPFEKDSLEYNREKQKRAEKNKSKKLPISQFDSLMQKLENEILEQKILEKKKQQTA